MLTLLLESTFSEVRVWRRLSCGCELCNEAGRDGEDIVVMGGYSRGISFGGVVFSGVGRLGLRAGD